MVLAIPVIAVKAWCQPAPPPAFDVAAVKVSLSGRPNGNPILGENIHATPGSLTMRHVTLKACIQWAYQVFEYQVSGPSWIDSEHYDVVAKAAGPAREPDLRLMLQTLLADRFQLELHRQTREVRAYVLSAGKELKVHESTTEGESDFQPNPQTMSVQVHRVPVSRLIDPISRILQMPVVDRTGLTGRYDVTIDVAKYVPQSEERPDPLTIIQTALREELGLKLEAKKMALDFLVVDHAARAPIEN